MRRIRSRILAVLAGGIVLATQFAAGSALAAPARGGGTTAVPTFELGIGFVPQQDESQCGGPRQQWTPSSEWSAAILLDTDQRWGGCWLGFGVRDLTGGLAGLSLSYRWEADPPGQDGSQCGNQGTYLAPVTPFVALGPDILVDTDRRWGGCSLTFSVSGRNDVALDVQFWASDPNGQSQCLFALPVGQWRTALPGSPVTIGIDTDQRVGGCRLALRLRQS